MTPEETQRFQELCIQVISEKDPATYAALVSELDAIMAAKEGRLRKQRSPQG